MAASLDKRWKEFLYAFAGFGPNFLMVIMGAYFTDAINPAALGSDSFQSIMGGTCFILPALFPILYALAKAFDGVIDIPFAHITDTLSTKWGRRRPAIAVCAVPMTLSFAMCWWPIGGADGQLLNTIWIIFWSFIFFASYTMCLIAYYGSLSTTCSDEPQRMRVSSYKSFFDTISYCLAYALVPLLLDSLRMHIDQFVYMCLPLMLTIVIPLFMIKEGERYGYPENIGLKKDKISLIESLKLTFKNKVYMSWLWVNCCTYFGLQLFLVSMNAMMIGGMGFTGVEMAIANTCAFAPVPVMLYLFNKFKRRAGIRLTYQTCLAAFAVALLSFFFASTFIVGEDNKSLQLLIVCIGSITGSWAIGSFFMMPYLAAAQISSVEERLTGRNHSAMYFAGNGVVSAIIGAISSSLIYENIKLLYFARGNGLVIRAESFEAAAGILNVASNEVFNLGTLLVPFLVFIICLVGVLLARKMPRDFTPQCVAAMLKKMDPSLDISSVTTDEELAAQQDRQEVIFVQVGLALISLFLFGFIWVAYLLKGQREFLNKRSLGSWFLCCLIPFGGAVLMYKRCKRLYALANDRGIQLKDYSLAVLISGLIIPLMPFNLIALALMQRNMNTLYRAN